MNTIIAPQRSLALPSSLKHPPSPASLARHAARTIGLWLLRWGSPQRIATGHARHSQLRQQQQARGDRELQWQSRALNAPLP
jgi:hypothetical protein